MNTLFTNKKRFTNIIYCMLLLLLGFNVSWGQQQVLGSFPYMDGGFEGQSATLAGTTIPGTLSASSWSVSPSSTSTTKLIINNPALARTGNKYASHATTMTTARLQSPTSVNVINAPAVSTQYTVQYYYKTTTDQTLSLQGSIYNDNTTGVSNNSKSALVTSSYQSGVWTKATVTLTTNTAAVLSSTNFAGVRYLLATSSTVNIDDFVVYAGAVDITAPTAPTAPTSAVTSSTTYTLGWTASTDTDKTGYMVVRYTTNPSANALAIPNMNGIYAVGNTISNGGITGTIVYANTGTSFAETVPSYGVSYYYRIFTVDKAFNYSSPLDYKDEVNTIPAPTAASQTFCTSSTVSNLVATGTDIKWYASANGGAPLAISTPLITGTYYVSQTIGTSESSRTAVTVSINDAQITASANTVCSGMTVELNINQQNFTSPNYSLFHQAGGYFADSNNDDYVVFPVSSTLNTNYSSWTMECWAKIISPGEEGILSLGNPEHGGGNIIGSGWSNTLAAGSNTDVGGGGTISSYNYPIAVWNHFALSYQNGTYRLFLNGILKESWSSGSTVVINDMYPLMTNTHWWWRGGDLSSHRMTVYYDDIRISKICRYASNFIPNTNWNNDNNTIGLWNFNEGSGNAVLDNSGNLNNGIIHGATYSIDVPSTSANSNLNYSYLWSNGETTATINPTPTVTTTYWCDVTTNGVTCRKEMTITVNPNPAPTASAQTFCANATVASLTATGTNLQWYATATGGTALATTTALSTGTYYASQTTNGCESSRTSVSVSINDAQITSSATTVCSGTPVSISFVENQSTINYSLDFPNSSQYSGNAEALCNSNLSGFDLTGNFTIEFWIKAEQSYYWHLMGKNTFGNNSQGWLLKKPGNDLTIAWTYVPNEFSFHTFNYNNWEHVAISFDDESNTFYYFKNGKLISSENRNININPAPYNFVIGHELGTGNWFKGKIDNLRISNVVRYTEDFNPSPNFISDSNTIAMYDFNEGFGGVAHDLSGNDRNLSLYNTNYSVDTFIGSSLSNRTYSWSTGETTATINPTPTATTTYWCDVTTNGLTCRKEITINITPKTIPTFVASAAVCSGSVIDALPTTSNNGITGTWSPALNNNETTTYTFTPNAGQCATTTTQTINITTPKVTSPISFVAPPVTVAALPNVTIGTQVWTNKNLDVSTYRDGTPIPQVTDQTEWANLTTGAWCYYNNDPAIGAIYGKMYNWYAVAGIHDNDPNTPNKILAPLGWHVPTDAEWTTLTDYLGGESVAGNKMKATTLWQPSSGITNTNSSGFTGLPGGCRYYNGSFTTIGYFGTWWSSSEFVTAEAWIRYLDYSNGVANRNYLFNKKFGFSVRCLRD